MAKEKIQYDVTVTGTTQASQGFEKVGGSISKAATASKSFETQVSGTNTAVGGLVTALSGADPRIAQFTFMVSGARTALTGLVSALGGPMGLLAGAAAGGAIAAIAYFTKEQTKSEEQIRKTTDAINEQAKALRDAAKAATAKYSPLSESQTIGRDIIDLERQARQAEKSGEPALASKFLEQRDAAQRALEEARAREANARREAEFKAALGTASLRGQLPGGINAETGEFEKGAGPKARTGPTEFDRMQAVDAQIAALDAQLAEPGQRRAETQLADDRAVAERRVQAKIEAIKAGFDTERQLREENMAEEQRAYEDHMARVAATRNETQQSVINLGEFATQSFAKGLGQLVKGQKVAVGAILEGIGDQMVAEGTHLLFKAAAAAWIPGMNIASGPLAAIGTAEIAAGLALGAGGHAAAGSAGGGGVGLGTARPVMSVNESQDSRPIIINLNNQIGPSAELGLVTAESGVRARQKYGDYVAGG